MPAATNGLTSEARLGIGAGLGVTSGMGVVARLVVALSVAVGPAIPVVVGLGASVVVGLGTSVAVPAAVSVGVGVASSAMTCEVPNGLQDEGERDNEGDRDGRVRHHRPQADMTSLVVVDALHE